MVKSSQAAVRKVRIEPSSAHADQHQTAPICTTTDPANAPESAPKCAIGGVVDDSLDDSNSTLVNGNRLPPVALIGVVETALARALTLAAEAGRWGIAAQLAEELSARGRRRGNSVPRETRAGSLATQRRPR